MPARKMIVYPDTFTYRYWQGLVASKADIDTDWHDFGNFLTDVGPEPSETHVLERIDTGQCYRLGNVRWSLPEPAISAVLSEGPDRVRRYLTTARVIAKRIATRIRGEALRAAATERQ